MDIFLTGATGYVGNHCMQELLAAGHTVSAVSRRESNPAHKGVTWVKGSLETLAELRTEIDNIDIIMHCAMGYTEKGEASDVDTAAMDIMLASGKFIVATGNLYTCRTDKDGLIAEALEDTPGNWRNQTETRILNSEGGGASIRLGFVYGGTGGFLWQIFEPCTDQLVFYTGGGASTWPMVHVEDVARLYRLIAEAKAGGIYHAADGTDISIKTLLTTVGTVRNAEPVEIPYEEAKEKLGGFADHMLRTIRPATGNTGALGWKPQHPSFKASAAGAYNDYITHRQKQAAE